MSRGRYWYDGFLMRRTILKIEPVRSRELNDRFDLSDSVTDDREKKQRDENREKVRKHRGRIDVAT